MKALLCLLQIVVCFNKVPALVFLTRLTHVGHFIETKGNLQQT